MDNSTEKVVYLQIRPNGTANTTMNIRDFGLSMQAEAERHGGVCLAFYANGVLTLGIKGLSPQSVIALLDAFTATVSRSRQSLQVVLIDDAEWNVKTPSDYHQPMLIRQKLTKKLLHSLPQGAYVVSNCFSVHRSIFAEQLGSIRTRAGAWERAVAAKANGCLCQVLWTPKDFIQSAFT